MPPGGASQGEVKERVMRAYFQEGVDIGDLEELVRLGVEAGLSERRLHEPLWCCARDTGRGWWPRSATPAHWGSRLSPRSFSTDSTLCPAPRSPRTWLVVFDQVADFAAAR